MESKEFFFLRYLLLKRIMGHNLQEHVKLNFSQL